MTNNDILRRLRFSFDFSDTKMIEIFALGSCKTNRATVSANLKKEEADGYIILSDYDFAKFLNGFIILHRGKQEGKEPVAEKVLNNNIIFRKLNIALNLRDEDILQLLESAEYPISKHELSAFFRKPDSSKYRECKDQILRYFLIGLQKKHKGVS
ncbi:MAG: DUF1456 domain-containing protein [Marinilabiliales bacterium]|nr:MAG: DUF1456 domain-containing protein [Marinilabiliales bacterium]